MNRIILMLFSFFAINLVNAQDKPLRPIKMDKFVEAKFKDSLGKGQIRSKSSKIKKIRTLKLKTIKLNLGKTILLM
jgi:hypothetical protein